MIVRLMRMLLERRDQSRAMRSVRQPTAKGRALTIIGTSRPSPGTAKRQHVEPGGEGYAAEDNPLVDVRRERIELRAPCADDSDTNAGEPEPPHHQPHLGGEGMSSIA